MANYCNKCGAALVNGACPRCDVPLRKRMMQTEAFTPVTWFRTLFSSRAPFRILPVVGFGVMGLVSLVYFFGILSSNGMLLGPARWLNIAASLSVACGMISIWHSQSRGAIADTAALGLFGLDAMLCLLQIYGTFLTIGMLLLFFTRFRTEKDPLWRALFGGGVAAIVLFVLIIPRFGSFGWLSNFVMCILELGLCMIMAREYATKKEEIENGIL